METKLRKKRLKYESMLKEDMDIEPSRSPTVVKLLKFVICLVVYDIFFLIQYCSFVIFSHCPPRHYKWSNKSQFLQY